MEVHKDFPIKLPCLLFFTKENDEFSEISEDTELEEEEEEYHGDNVDDGNDNDDDNSNGGDDEEGDTDDGNENDNENDHGVNEVVEEENDEEDYFKYRAFYSVVNKESYKEENIQKINPKRCWNSSQGWLLISEYETSKCFLLNPITMQQFQLPFLELEESSWKCKLVLSSSPVSSCCIVMFGDFDGRRLLFCKLTSSNDLKWVSYDYSDQFDQMEEFIKHVTFTNGKFYGLSLQNHILIIDTEPHPLITFINMDRIDEPCPFQYHGFYSSFLDSCGELYYVMRMLTNGSRKLAYVRIYKADLVERKWNKVTSIEDRSFLLDSRGFSASWSSKDLGLKSNCIYFVDRQSACMGIYNIGEGSVKTEVPFTKSYFPPLWILPPI